MSGPSSTRQPWEFGESLRNCWLVLSFLRHTAVERTPVTTMFVMFSPAGTRTQKPSEGSQINASDAIVKNSNNVQFTFRGDAIARPYGFLPSCSCAQLHRLLCKVRGVGCLSFVYSQIQGPGSFSKYFSKRHKKIAPPAQMSANVIDHTMITAQFDTQ